MQIDDKLISACLDGERAAQQRLYTRLLPYLTTICSRYLADRSYLQDTLQESFLDVFRNIKSFDQSKASFSTWAVRITINRCLKTQRKKTLVDFVDEQTLQVSADEVSTMEAQDLIRFLRQMPKDQYEVFNLHVLDGYPHKEIADILGISEALSRKRLSRARAWLEDNTNPTTRELAWNSSRGKST